MLGRRGDQRLRGNGRQRPQRRYSRALASGHRFDRLHCCRPRGYRSHGHRSVLGRIPELLRQCGLGQYDLGKINIRGPKLVEVSRKYRMSDQIQRELRLDGPHEGGPGENGLKAYGWSAISSDSHYTPQFDWR